MLKKLIVKTKMPDKKLELIIDTLEKRVSVLEKQIKSLSKNVKRNHTKNPKVRIKYLSPLGKAKDR